MKIIKKAIFYWIFNSDLYFVNNKETSQGIKQSYFDQQLSLWYWNSRYLHRDAPGTWSNHKQFQLGGLWGSSSCPCSTESRSSFGPGDGQVCDIHCLSEYLSHLGTTFILFRRKVLEPAFTIGPEGGAAVCLATEEIICKRDRRKEIVVKYVMIFEEISGRQCHHNIIAYTVFG